MLAPLGDILVCAPDGPRSGFACAFSATTPLQLVKRWERQGVEVWSSNGTPVDCVKLALSQLMQRKPDLVIGGSCIMFDNLRLLQYQTSETVSIHVPDATRTSTPAAIYDLTGRRVASFSSDQRAPLQPGIYIVDGHKKYHK